MSLDLLEQADQSCVELDRAEQSCFTWQSKPVMSRGSSIPFRDEGSRRQWESSIGIVHSTPKDAVISSGSRVYVNPLKEQANRHRPVSPLLNLDEDRMNMDEYADVAGHFFTDVMTTSVPSRGGKRQKQLKEMRDAKNSSTVSD